MKSLKSLIIVLWSLLLVLGSMGSAFGYTFIDSFEGTTLDPFWTVEQLQYGQFSLSSVKAQEGSQSLMLSSSSGGQRYVTLGHQFGQTMQGTVSVWFYDGHPAQETLYCNLLLNDRPQINQTWIGVMDYYPYVYHAGGTVWPGPADGKTAIPRSESWHKLEAIYASSGASLFIDGLEVRHTNANIGFDHIQLQLSGPVWRTNTEFYFDQFSVNANPVPIPGSVFLLGSSLLGLVGWRRFRKV